MKQLMLLIMLINVATCTFALRCHGKLVYENDTRYQLEQKCGPADGVNSDIWQDQKELYYEGSNGATTTVEVINGRVVNIDENRRD